MQNFRFIDSFAQKELHPLNAAYRIARDYVVRSDIICDTAEMREVLARKIFVTAQGGENKALILADHAIAFAYQFQRMQRILRAEPA
jgi:hypothetical protein